MFGLSALGTKLAIYAAIAVVVGGVFVVQHIRVLSLRAENADLRAAEARLEFVNERQAELIDDLTRDKAAFERRAAEAEARAAETKATVVVKTNTVVRRITEHATPEDRQPVSPAFRDVLRSVRP